MKIVINGGHCPGMDSGAVGATGLEEAVVTCDMMAKVTCFLQAAGHDVLFIQENELYQIIKMANDFCAKLFVSLHCNAAENRHAKGVETYFYYNSVEGVKLAACIQSRMMESVATLDRGIKEAGFYVLRYTEMIAVLVEMGFISNVEDEQLLIEENSKQNIAKAIADGIIDYITC